MLQTIKVGEKNFNIFYDTGCGDIVVKKSAIDALIIMGRANLELPGRFGDIHPGDNYPGDNHPGPITPGDKYPSCGELRK